MATAKNINSKSYEESFVFPLLCTGVNSFAKQASSPSDFLATSPDGVFKVGLTAEKMLFRKFTRCFVRTPQKVLSHGSLLVYIPHQHSARNRKSLFGFLLPLLELTRAHCLLCSASTPPHCFASPEYKVIYQHN